MAPHFFRTFRVWLPLAIALTGMFGVVSVVVQQNYRLSGNDPQIQMAEDAAATLSKGEPPASLVSRTQTPINLAQSLAPWIVIYDASGTPLESSAVLNNAPPQLPLGVFDITTWRTPHIARYGSVDLPANENRFTWQPQVDVRQAVVLVRYHTDQGIGFVAAGRNLREIEARESALELITILGWFVTELVTLVAAFIVTYATIY